MTNKKYVWIGLSLLLCSCTAQPRSQKNKKFVLSFPGFKGKILTAGNRSEPIKYLTPKEVLAFIVYGDTNRLNYKWITYGMEDETLRDTIIDKSSPRKDYVMNKDAFYIIKITGIMDKEVNKNVFRNNFEYPSSRILRLYDKNFALRDSLEIDRSGNYEGTDISHSLYNTDNNLIFWYGTDVKKDVSYTKARLYKIDTKKLKFVLLKEKVLYQNKSTQIFQADDNPKSVLKQTGFGKMNLIHKTQLSKMSENEMLYTISAICLILIIQVVRYNLWCSIGNFVIFFLYSSLFYYNLFFNSKGGGGLVWWFYLGILTLIHIVILTTYLIIQFFKKKKK